MARSLDILSNLSDYEKIIPEYHELRMSSEQFMNVLSGCKTKDQAVSLIKKYKPENDIERRLLDFRDSETVAPFCKFLDQNKPDFLLEAFITAGWNFNELLNIGSFCKGTPLCFAFNREKYRIVRLLLEAGASKIGIQYTGSRYESDSEEIEYFHSFEKFNSGGKTIKDYIDFAVYVRYLLKTRRVTEKEVAEFGYTNEVLRWYEGIIMFDLIVLRSRKTENIFSRLNKDVIGIIKSFLLQCPLQK
jgi:hypothetical protein